MDKTNQRESKVENCNRSPFLVLDKSHLTDPYCEKIWTIMDP